MPQTFYFPGRVPITKDQTKTLRSRAEMVSMPVTVSTMMINNAQVSA
jgi:hypothetical protein